MRFAWISCPIVILLLCGAPQCRAQAVNAAPPNKIPVLFDTDVGGYIDDAFALGLILASPELELRGVTTVDGDAYTRAQLVCNFLYALNRSKIPVAAGSPPRAKPDYEGQMQYGLRPPYTRPVKPLAVEFLYERLKAAPGELTIICVGPLTNIAALLDKQPDAARWIKRLVVMGGSLTHGYEGKPGAVAEWNIRQDIKAAQKVFTTGLPILLVPLDATARLAADEKLIGRVFTAQTVLGNHLHALQDLSGKEAMVLFEPLAVALCIDETFCTFEERCIEVDGGGITRSIKGASNSRVAVSAPRDDFWEWTAKRLAQPVLSPSDLVPKAAIHVAANGDYFLQGNRVSRSRIEELVRQSIAATPPLDEIEINGHRQTKIGNVRDLYELIPREKVRLSFSLPKIAVGKSIARGNFPNRVHVVENYETDIERRWWLAGKLETKNVPDGSRRACRAVLCRDFDDQQGERLAIHKAVIFNPVPGPPMGKNTRLTFRYHLQGTDSIRVQLYTLSKGYHRQLTITGLPQGRWETATVDMTQARRPDGSGGSLSGNERIDDIQFYVDPAAELLIDDIVLYDAAAEDEKRPFPRHVHFTGWFDTGKQGAEWPGDFKIVEHELPRSWKAAQSLPSGEGKAHWIRVGLRGPRPISPNTRLRFRYHVKNAGHISAELRLRDEKRNPKITRMLGSPDEQGEFDVDFADAFAALAPAGGKPRATYESTDIVFHVFAGSELLVDDVLLYEPGEPEEASKPSVSKPK